MKAAAHKILGALSATLACAAVLAGGVQAAERPDDRGGMLGVGAAQAVIVPDAFERAFLRHAAATPVPDAFERAVIREQATTAVRPDDRPGLRGPGLVPTAPTSVATASDGGFAWDDAAFGAGAMLGLALLGTAILGIRRRGGVVLR